jgi:hypothetical protein
LELHFKFLLLFQETNLWAAFASEAKFATHPSQKRAAGSFLTASLTTLFSPDKNRTFKNCYLLARQRDSYKGPLAEPPLCLPPRLLQDENQQIIQS